MTETARRVAYRLARRYFAEGMDLDDWRQEALTAAWQAEQSFDGTGDLGGWVALCVRRRLTTVLKTATALKRPRFGELHDVHPAREEQDTRELVAEIRHLPRGQQRALVALAAGLSYQEIMRLEGVGYRAVDNRLYKARRNLRERLAA